MLTVVGNQGFATCDRCDLRVQTSANQSQQVWSVQRPADWELVKLKQKGHKERWADLCPACLFMLTDAKVACHDCETPAERHIR